MYSGASALLLDCTIADCNAASGYSGGGLQAYRANLILKGCRVQRCHSTRGGGVDARFCNLELLDGSIVTECTGDITGGGMRPGLRRTCLHRVPLPIGLLSHSLHNRRVAKDSGIGRHWCSADSLCGLPTLSSETHRRLYESRTWMNQSSVTNCNGTGISIWAGMSGAVHPNFFVGTNSVRVGKSNSHPTSQEHRLIAY